MLVNVYHLVQILWSVKRSFNITNAHFYRESILIINFLILKTFLCQKYGYRPLKKFIIESEFEMLCDVTPKEDADLLRKWYWLDKNCLPPTYVLLKISTYYKNFCNKAEKALMQQDQGLWWGNMAKMNTIIRKASAKLLAQKRFTHDDNHRFQNISYLNILNHNNLNKNIYLFIDLFINIDIIMR